jgi:hypothetical protein
MVEVELLGEEGFRKVKETLTRIGLASRTEKVLTQSAHILHRQGRYYICHFKELLALDGLRTDLSESDIARRNRIVQMLAEWGLVKVFDATMLEPMGSPNVVKVIKYADKDEWDLRTKYTIGIRHKEAA